MYSVEVVCAFSTVRETSNLSAQEAWLLFGSWEVELEV